MYQVDPKETQLVHKQIYQPGSLRLVSNKNAICEPGFGAMTFTMHLRLMILHPQLISQNP